MVSSAAATKAMAAATAAMARGPRPVGGTKKTLALARQLAEQRLHTLLPKLPREHLSALGEMCSPGVAVGAFSCMHG